MLLALVLLALPVGGMFLPARVEVERSVTLNRPAATVFTLMNGFRTWPQWSPWAGVDPGAEFLRSGPDAGVGARLEWTGDPARIGTGWQEIVASEPWRRIALRTDIGAQGGATTEYLVAGDQLGSRVTWVFHNDVTEGKGLVGGLVGRYFGLFLKRWVAADFEQGLARLEAFAAAVPERDFSTADIALVEVESIPVLAVSAGADGDPDTVASALAAAYTEITGWALANDVPLGGQPLAVTRSLDGPSGPDFRVEAALPLGEPGASVPEPSGRVRLSRSPGGMAARIVHEGAFDNTLVSYERLQAWIAAHGYRDTGVSWEHYVTDPGETPEQDLRTHIYFLVEDAPSVISRETPGSGAGLPIAPGE